MSSTELVALGAVAIITALTFCLVIVSAAAVRREQEAYAEGRRDGAKEEATAALLAVSSAERMQGERVERMLSRAEAGQPLSEQERRELATLQRVRHAAEQLARRQQLNAAREAAGAPPLPPRHDLAHVVEAAEFLRRRAARIGKEASRGDA